MSGILNRLGRESRMPALDGATGWINSEPLTPESLRGSVVLVQFWTFTCINWLRTLPYVRAWYEKYRDHGLVVIGVHTPEFGVEHDLDRVRRATREMAIEYPVAADNDYAVWDAFSNRYWPAAYFVDAEGTIRSHQFGEGRYDESERVIQELLHEAGRTGVEGDLVSVVGSGAEAPPELSSLESLESYVGYARADGFASPGGALLDESSAYHVPAELRLGDWGLEGSWTVGRESARSNEPGGIIDMRFHARDLHLVMGAGSPLAFQVRLDGQAPGDGHGVDTDHEGGGTVSEPRLYQLVRQQAPVVDRTFEIAFDGPGAEAFVFTFG